MVYTLRPREFNAGRLREPIVIEGPGEAGGQKNDFNEPIGPEALRVECLAAVEGLSGRELLLAQQVASEVTHRLTIRWREGVTSEMRAAWNGKYLNFLSVVDRDGRRSFLEIMAVERDGD